MNDPTATIMQDNRGRTVIKISDFICLDDKHLAQLLDQCKFIALAAKELS